MITVRLLRYSIADGAHNMAADELLLEGALNGVATLRFYGWSQPTVSLGYFQSHRVHSGDVLLSSLPFVRRPTGGATLVHHHELTYAIALPAALAMPNQGAWPTRMHRLIARALLELGIDSRVSEPATGRPRGRNLCFEQQSSGDLLVGTDKVVGSAQRKRRGALLQHGAVLLARSAFTPSLLGIVELAGRALDREHLQEAIVLELCRSTGWKCEAVDMTEFERLREEELVRTKYGALSWNCKR
jgi:lipoate-protein ligase A